MSGDGRNLTLYDAEFVDGLLRAYDEGRFADVADEHDVDVILSEAAGPTYRELTSHADWVGVHRDRLAAVFVRRDTARALPARPTARPALQAREERFYFP